MTVSRKILLVHAPERPVKAGTPLDLARLREALAGRGAEVQELPLGSGSDNLLDRLEAGAMPVVFRGDAS